MGHRPYSHLAGNAMLHAAHVARSQDDPTITASHILLGLLAVSDTAVGRMQQLGANPARLREDVLARSGLTATIDLRRRHGHVPFDETVRETLRHAERRARATGEDEPVRTRHLLLGILDAGNSIVADVLDAHGIDAAAIEDIAVPGSPAAHSDFAAAFDSLLHDRHPLAWRVAGANPERLAAACLDYLAPERMLELESPGFDRAAWILDRLLPLDAAQVFHGLNLVERRLPLLYAWLRRAPQAVDSVTSERFQAGESLAVEAAWVDQPWTASGVLGWAAECARRGWDNHPSNRLAAIEYGRSAADLERLTDHLATAPRHEHAALLHTAMRLAAPRLPRTDQAAGDVAGRLERAGLEQLAKVVARIANDPTPDDRTGAPRDELTREEALAATLWIEQQGAGDREALAQLGTEAAAHRLARVVPATDVSYWRRAVPAGAPVPLVRACGTWCPPAHLDILQVHFDDHRHKPAIHAFATYLARAARGSGAEWPGWITGGARPAWQLALLDRRLHAPAPLRPGAPVLVRPWELVYDVRAQDPFEPRDQP